MDNNYSVLKTKLLTQNVAETACFVLVHVLNRQINWKTVSLT